MKKPTKNFLLHSLHLLTIGLLGFLVLKNIRQNGEAVLYETLNISLEQANAQAVVSGQFTTDEIHDEVAAYNFEAFAEVCRRAIRINSYTENARSEFQKNRENLLAEQKQLALYYDTLASTVFGEPQYIAYFEKLLRQPLQRNNIAELEHAKVAQIGILHKFLYFNLTLSNNLALENLLKRVASRHENVDFFQPILIPKLKYPVAGQMYTSTVLLGGWSYSNFDKVWVDGLNIPIKNQAARFSTTFEKAGTRALSIRAEKCCFGCEHLPVIYEKTYTVHVHQ